MSRGARQPLCTALAVVAASLLACDSEGTAPVADPELQALEADQLIVGMDLNVTADGIRRAVLRADTAYIYDDSAVVSMRGVHLTFYDPIGRETGDLTSERGRLRTDTQEMTAIGSVVLVTTEGSRRVETEELNYDPRSDRVWSDVAVVLQRDGTRVRGDGFASDGRLEVIDVRNPTGQFEGVGIEF